MSEASPLQTADGVAAEEQVVQVSAGALLRAAREAAGLHVAALAVSMKVPVKKLEALEADRFDLLPDAVFVRALASSVCRNLKIDPVPVLSRLPHQDVPRLSASERGLNAPFHAAGETRSLSVPATFRQPAVLVVVLLLVAALAVLFFPEWQADAPAEEAPATAESALVMPAAPANGVADLPAATTPVDPVAQPQAAASSVPALVPTVPMVAASQVASPVVAASAPPSAAVAGQQVIFRVKGSSWVEVTDAKGVVLMRRNLVEGDAVGVSGALPLSVVVGRADVTEVEVRGKPFNLAAIAKDNVARFEVK